MKLLGKLRYRIRERWRMHKYRIKASYHELANFHDYVKFVREQIATDSVYGDISVESSKENRQNRKFSKGLSTVLQEERSNSKIRGRVSDDSKCLYCAFHQRLEICRKLGSKSHEEKPVFLCSKGLCFSCLEGNHVSKDCKQDRLVCEICQKPHPRVLHYPRKPKQKSPKDTNEDQTPKETVKQVKPAALQLKLRRPVSAWGPA
ncbi:hypothetical protein HOLleu_06244 [Holothuria leucospilota]|uniref:CCHC-type domain-containing protein n=1 Tax=Holothuria leucospilota TaxID=206669 RepID=A0A9Q1HF11_HOLLE|nr:hypothetical protein HOLleu_06244 [Holothuria leucospilota]